jgi:hypothetical protein
MRPQDLGERLLRHGFSCGSSEIEMAADLSALPKRVPVLEDLRIERVRGEEDLATWSWTLARGFGGTPGEAEWVCEMYRRLSLGDDGPWRHYLLLSRNVHLKYVQELLGHATVAITLDTYSHVIPGMGDHTARAMEDVFS